MTVTKLWEYRNTPDTYAYGMGNMQRLPNGNTMIGWGTATPTLTEVRPEGSKAFELTLDDLHISYRAFRFPWQGRPDWPPQLVVRDDGDDPALHFSWNGATGIESYRIYAGRTPDTPTLAATVSRTGFETSIEITDHLDQFCYFRVMPVDAQGHETRFSNLVSLSSEYCQPVYLPGLLVQVSEG